MASISYLFIVLSLLIFSANGVRSPDVSSNVVRSPGGPNAVGSSDVSANALRSPDVSANALRSPGGPNAVRSPDLSANAVGSPDVSANAVGSADVSADALPSSDVSANDPPSSGVSVNSPLSPNFYAKSCPKLARIVRTGMAKAVNQEKRIAASILRLFFHDCFVDGCDAGILLDDTPTFTGEKNAFANKNSARGFEVIDDIKRHLEVVCRATVSCADILALATRDGIVMLGGPTWTVPLGRKDARTASQERANSNLPGPDSDLANLVSVFGDHGMNPRDMTALTGAHTIGMTNCEFVLTHIHNETNIDPIFAKQSQEICPFRGGATKLLPLDKTPDQFDNQYFIDLTKKQGVFHSDQELFNNGLQDPLVETYSKNATAFKVDFVNAMIKLGKLGPPAGIDTEIRRNCRVVNNLS